MDYVEFLRARKALGVFAITLFCTVAFGTASALYGLHGHHGPISITQDGHRMERSGIPLGIVLGIMIFPTMLLGTILATSLNKENVVAGLAFTKPAPRERIALGYIAIDAATILLSYLYGVAIVLGAMLVLGIFNGVVAQPGSLQVALGGLGATFMWYGLLQALTAMRTSSGGLFIGLSYPVFFILGGLYAVDAFGPVFHAVVAALDVFNPLAYFNFQSHNQDVTVTSFFGLSQGACIAVTWSMAIAACAVAIFEWKRVEL